MQISMKQARIGIDATQADLAEKMGISKHTYMKIEKDPGRSTIKQAMLFSRIVKVPMEQIFFVSDSIKK